jgi:hypothetical protein
MLETRQHIQLGYFHDFSSPSSLTILLQKGKKEIAYLLLPEDSSHVDGDCQNRMDGLMPGKIRSMVKTIFWIGISIAIPLVLGNS